MKMDLKEIVGEAEIHAYALFASKKVSLFFRAVNTEKISYNDLEYFVLCSKVRSKISKVNTNLNLVEEEMYKVVAEIKGYTHEQAKTRHDEIQKNIAHCS